MPTMDELFVMSTVCMGYASEFISRITVISPGATTAMKSHAQNMVD
jgi:hypothetical protein